MRIDFRLGPTSLALIASFALGLGALVHAPIAAAAACSFPTPSPLPSADSKIESAADLQWLRDNSAQWSASWTQTANIDMGDCDWTTSIGNGTTQFTGSYDGGGYSISGLTIAILGGYSGLFGYVDSNGEIRNVRFSGDVSGGSATGGLVGSLRDFAAIRNSYASGNVTSTGSNVGGLVGQVTTASGPVVIENSYATGGVTAVSGDNVGGLVGGLASSEVTNSYSTGAVNGDTDVGGLVGSVTGSTSTISYTWTSSSVTGNTNVGGLIGYTNVPSGGFTSSFWNTDNGPSTSAGGVNVTGKTTSEMQDASTYVGWSLATSGLGSTWGICSSVNDGYPFLTAFYSSDPCVNPPSPSAGDSSRPTATFHFRLPDGTECSLISPQLVYTERTFILPGSSAPCRTPGSELLGWAVPHHDWYFAPGATVYVVDSQVFTAVLRQPTIRVTWSANVALEDPCLKQSDDSASNAGAAQRTQTEYLHRPDLPADTRAGVFPSVDDAFAPQQAPCTPPGYVLEGWSALNSDAPAEVAPGDPLAPAIQEASPTGAESRFVFQAKWVPQQTPSTTSWAGFYEGGSDTLSPKGRQQLQAIISATTSATKPVDVKIVGVSKSLETPQQNARLANTRARTLQALLQEAGIDATYTTTTDPALVQPEQAQSGKPLTTVRITSTR